jgi:hypothetical protein
MRKVLAAHWRRMHSAREVQKCIEAIRATAPDTVEHQQAFLAYGMALQRELEKSGFSVSPPGAAQNIAALLQKFETGTATTSETGTPLALELSENDLGDCLVEQFKRGGGLRPFSAKECGSKRILILPYRQSVSTITKFGRLSRICSTMSWRTLRAAEA